MQMITFLKSHAEPQLSDSRIKYDLFNFLLKMAQFAGTIKKSPLCNNEEIMLIVG